ncbi:MAG: hypothetical protein JXA25_00360 [Anaerolineales bacterium]|nr:hypothetical protein [Anaerolineales bacterium]
MEQFVLQGMDFTPIPIKMIVYKAKKASRCQYPCAAVQKRSQEKRGEPSVSNLKQPSLDWGESPWMPLKCGMGNSILEYWKKDNPGSGL